MNLFLWILFGAIAGWIASIIMQTEARQGLLGDIFLGVFGALVGGLVMSFFGQAVVSGFNLYGLFVAVLGSALLIGVGRAFR